jgi:hypothetical protein
MMDVAKGAAAPEPADSTTTDVVSDVSVGSNPSTWVSTAIVWVVVLVVINDVCLVTSVNVLVVVVVVSVTAFLATEVAIDMAVAFARTT